MPSASKYPHITKKTGKPACLENHPRTRVSMIVGDYLWRGWSAEQIVQQYSYLTLAEVHGALTYYFDHHDEIESELVEEYRDVERWKKAHPTPALILRLKEKSSA